nr:gluconate 2-dehydrogenase subunit 3 family protein [Burkholderia sp. WP9]
MGRGFRVLEFIDRPMDTLYGHGALWYMQAQFAVGVPELVYQSELVPRGLYRLGIRAVDEYCLHERGKRFADLPPEARRGTISHCRIIGSSLTRCLPYFSSRSSRRTFATELTRNWLSVSIQSFETRLPC